MFQPVHCPHCGGEHYSSAARCMHCNGELFQLNAAQLPAKVAPLPTSAAIPAAEAPGNSNVFAILVASIGGLLLSMGGRHAAEVLASAEAQRAPFGRAIQPENIAAEIIMGALLLGTAWGLYRCQRWAWWMAVGVFGLSVFSHVWVLGRMVMQNPVLLAAMLFDERQLLPVNRALFSPGFDGRFFIGIILFHPFVSLFVQAIIVAYYLIVHNPFIAKRRADRERLANAA